jgi:cytochrome oxidase assembly protein ShyY1
VSVYGFLRSPRWIGLGLLMTLLAAVMVGLGFWQLSRFHQRSAINDRIDAGSSASPVPLSSLLPAPGSDPAASVVWTRVTVTGTYDASHQILARARTVGDNVGFEVLTPLVLPSGDAVLIDRGWIPPASSGSATAAPSVPAVPPGQVTVTGRLHAPESRASAPEPFAGGLAVRRIAPSSLASALPYPLYGGYVTMDSQVPPAASVFVQIPADHENAAMNAGYVVQWWAFALLTLAGYVYLVRREAYPPAPDSSFADEAELVAH